MAERTGGRRRVLLIAEAANPEWVSVPLVGWSLANALRAHADVHVVTQTRNRDAFLRAGLAEGPDFTAIDSEAVAGPLWRLASVLRMGKGKGWTMVAAINAVSYPWFEHLVWRQFGDRIRAGEFDLVHRITPLSPTVASSLAAKCAGAGVPFLLGPLNGGVPWPKGFARERWREREWLSYLRDAYKLLPGRNRTLTHAAAILAGSGHTHGEIPERHRARAFLIPENGIDPARFPPSAPRPAPSGPLRACFIGRLVPYKGPDMLVEAALPLLRAGSLALDIIGDGPLMPELRALALREGVTERITFHGWLEHRAVQAAAAGAEVFAFPSIREFGGGAVVEAMAMGLVPLIVDYAGPGELVPDGMGVKVPLGPRTAIVAGVQAGLADLLARRADLARMGAEAEAHVRARFTWAAKADQVARVWDWVLAPGSPRPEFGFGGGGPDQAV